MTVATDTQRVIFTCKRRVCRHVWAVDIFDQFGPVEKSMRPSTQHVPTLWDETA